MDVCQIGEVTKLATLLVNNVKFRSEYSAMLNGSSKVLLVEGATDERFIKKITIDRLVCINADKVFNSNVAFSTTKVKRVKSKDSIKSLVFGVTRFPSPFVMYPDDLDKWDLYGLIDLDSDEASSMKKIPRLFVTDTHDLETLLISTDKSIFRRIKECDIFESDILKAYFVAFQLSQIREKLGWHHDDANFNTRVILCGSCQVDFSKFVCNDKIDLAELVKYIAQHSDSPASAEKIKRITDTLLQDKIMKKMFTAEGFWKKNLESFDPDTIPDFWTSVNGHDILQLIQYYNGEAERVFGNGDPTRLNRKFELALIDHYDTSKLYSTQIYKRMKDEGIVKDVI